MRSTHIIKCMSGTVLFSWLNDSIMHTIFWLENLKGIDPLEDLGVDGKVILEWI
jgi:hypothetical protein